MCVCVVGWGRGRGRGRGRKETALGVSELGRARGAVSARGQAEAYRSLFLWLAVGKRELAATGAGEGDASGCCAALRAEFELRSRRRLAAPPSTRRLADSLFSPCCSSASLTELQPPTVRQTMGISRSSRYKRAATVRTPRRGGPLTFSPSNLPPRPTPDRPRSTSHHAQRHTLTTRATHRAPRRRRTARSASTRPVASPP